jgi:hypothetical protein
MRDLSALKSAADAKRRARNLLDDSLWHVWAWALFVVLLFTIPVIVVALIGLSR